MNKIIKKIRIIIYSLIYEKPIIAKKLSIFEEKKKISIEKNNYEVSKIKKGRLYTDNNYFAGYILPNNTLSNISYQYVGFKKSKSASVYNAKLNYNPILNIGTPRLAKKYKKKILSLLSGGASRVNFTHWFEDVLPRIYLFKKCFPRIKIDKILVPSKTLKFQVESLKNFGFKNHQILTAENNKHIICDELYATTHPSLHNPERVPKWNLNFIKKSFHNNNNLSFNRIYIDRVFKKNVEDDLSSNRNLKQYKNIRYILNNAEIKKYLVNLNFTIIRPENYSLNDQISIFSNAKIVVSIYGAALYMINFCKKKTKVIEIKPFLSGNDFLRISNINGLIHRQIKIKPHIMPDNTQQGLLICPLYNLKKTFTELKIN